MKDDENMMFSQHGLENQQEVAPKLENFLGIGRDRHLQPGTTAAAAVAVSVPSANNNPTFGLSMIKNWLRTNKTTNSTDSGGCAVTAGMMSSSQAQSLSLSMGAASQPTPTAAALPLLNISGGENDHHLHHHQNNVIIAATTSAGCLSESENNSQQNENGTSQSQASADAQTSTATANGLDAAVSRKSIDTFGQRTSIYRGVTRYKLYTQ